MYKIAITANIMPKDRTRDLYKGKELHYFDDELIEAVEQFSDQIEVTLLPIRPLKNTDEWIKNIDLLILSGGADVHPSFYGEEPTYEWKGSKKRDQLEIEWIQAARRQGTNVLGVCRGAQVLNVALGGSLYQDLPTTFKDIGEVHRSSQTYDKNYHQVRLNADGILSKFQQKPDQGTLWTNSVHHQGLKNIAEGCNIEARSMFEDLVEAISFKDSNTGAFMLGLQWHPEWMTFSEEPLSTSDDAAALRPKVGPFLTHSKIWQYLLST